LAYPPPPLPRAKMENEGVFKFANDEPTGGKRLENFGGFLGGNGGKIPGRCLGADVNKIRNILQTAIVHFSGFGSSFLLLLIVEQADTLLFVQHLILKQLLLV